MSLAYVKAVAARAGFSTAVPEPDRDSVDLRIMAGGPRRPALDLQLKARTDLAEPQAGFRRIRLSIKNYNRGALLAVSPAALSAYARATGWRRHEPYREHSDVYVGESRPEIIVPRTERLGDYASVVATLIDTFAGVTGHDELSVYRSLTTADRDVIRVRAAESDDGSVTLNAGVHLISGARDMLLSVACSLREPRPVYRAGANREAVDLLNHLRLGQTDHGSFVVTLLTPVVPAPLPGVAPGPGRPERPNRTSDDEASRRGPCRGPSGG